MKVKMKQRRLFGDDRASLVSDCGARTDGCGSGEALLALGSAADPATTSDM